MLTAIFAAPLLAFSFFCLWIVGTATDDEEAGIKVSRGHNGFVVIPVEAEIPTNVRRPHTNRRVRISA